MQPGVVRGMWVEPAGAWMKEPAGIVAVAVVEDAGDHEDLLGAGFVDVDALPAGAVHRHMAGIRDWVSTFHAEPG